VSAYALIVEAGHRAGTPRFAGVRSRTMPDDDDMADKYALADELLTAARGMDVVRSLQLGAAPGQ
jgi:hypothetical protein